MKKLIYTLICLCVPLALLAQTNTENYIKTTAPQVEVQTEAALNALSADNKIESITYFDGLGRPVQSIAKQSGGQHQDIITPIIYDGYGRQVKDYLPYARTNSSLDYELPDQLMINLDNQYLNKYASDLDANFPNPFSEKVFEASPLNRVLEQAAPGSDWAVGNGHTIKFDYQTNTLNPADPTDHVQHTYDNVRRFSVAHPNGDTEQTALMCEGFYEPNTLYKTVTKDENWTSGNNHTTHEFKNKLGQVILKRTFNKAAHDTYYVYDKFGNLTYVIPPEASDDIVFMGKNSLGSTQVNYSWITMAEVDRELAESYNRQLAEYDNSDILTVDLNNKYGAQGGFTINTNNGNDVVTMSISLSATEPLTLKQGELISLKDYGEYKDTELGRISGSGYSYTFYIRNNSIYVSGKGQLSQINTSFNSSNTLDYTKNLDWRDLINESRSADANGGLSLSIDADDNISLSLNLSSNSPITFRKGQLIPLGTKRRIADRALATATINGNDYHFSIKDNSLSIEGSDAFTIFTYSNYSAKGMLGEDVCGIDTKVLEGLGYIYHYDYRNRLIEKKIPGKGWEHIVYDKLDRPILTQDAVQRIKKQWLVTTYDVFGRVAYTGIWQAGYYAPSRGNLQTSVTNNTSAPLFETRESTTTTQGGTAMYYTNQSHYASYITALHTINYYDSYDNVGLSGTDLIKQEGETIFDAQIAMNTKGLTTVSKVRVLETNTWITSVSYFDEKGMPIYVASTNEYLNTTDYVKTDYDFTGKVITTERTHKKDSNTPIVITDSFIYDHAARLHTQTQTINSGTPELIVDNTYDALGQLESKNIGGNTTGNGLQTVDYSYNIRGWLKTINNDNVADNDLFNFRLNYNNPTYGLALYNGNISETFWETARDNQLRGYDFSYDALGRLTRANYHNPTTGSVEDYSLSRVRYDKNGNILSLKRNGFVIADNDIDVIDDLVYSYEPHSNKLLNIHDTATIDGFKDGSNSQDDYIYDSNGSLITDLNKGISEINYNSLNLANYLAFEGEDQEGEIIYTFDALGTKLSKEVTDDNDGTVTQIFYAGSFVYENGNLKQFAHPEGYVSVNNGTNFEYVYSYLDHLNSVRLSYSDSNGNDTIEAPDEIIEEHNYTPFGLEILGINNVVNGVENNHQTYQGQEHEKELGKNSYAFQWRDYDPAKARFDKIDRFAEKYEDLTPYHFTANNPIYFREIAGDSLVVTGYKTAKDKLSKTINDGLGGFYKTNINERGLVTLEATGKEGKLTKKQQAFYDTLSEAIDLNKSMVSIEIIESSESVLVGSFDLQAIDIDDVNAFGDGPIVSSYAKIGHEVAEQTEKQRNGKEFNEAHTGAAVNAENSISGSTRIDVNDVAPTTNITNISLRGVTGTIGIRYKNGGETKTVTLTVENHNVIKVEQ